MDYGEELIKDLRFLQEGNNFAQLNEFLFLPIDRAVSENRQFFDDKEAQTRIASKALQATAGNLTDNEHTKRIIQRYILSPFGLLDFVTQLNASDIFIVSDKIVYTGANNNLPTVIKIPGDLYQIYIPIIDRFINTTLQASKIDKTKFGRADAIKDYELGHTRFNVVHESLSAKRDERPIISLRTQLLDFNRNSFQEINAFNENYITEQNLSDKQLHTLNKLATNGSYIIFGETGSGKTTLMKYMGYYNFNKKRNLITIEDTAELFLPNDIAYLTNNHTSIRDLFKVSLRENPSHMLIGETRSEEIVDILESGLVFHCGTTLHADSFDKVIMRIIFLMKNSATTYSTEDIEMLITSVIDGFIYMKDRKIQTIWKRKTATEELKDLTDVLHNYKEIV